MEKKSYERLVTEIKDGKSNCIIVQGDEILKFILPGVKTLMTILKENPEVLKDSIVFDKVVGKGAAALMILGEVSEIYAEIISENAINLLKTTDIKFRYNKKVPYIENKNKTGLCPIENLSLTSNEPTEIYKKIQCFLSAMNNN